MSDPLDEPDPSARPRARTLTVVLMLVSSSAVFSYLIFHAVAGAFVAAELISPWPTDRDPRPRWVGYGFVGILSCLTIAASVARILSRRQLRRIDQMELE